MEDDSLPPRSVKDRIALLQQPSTSSSSSQSLSSSTQSAASTSSHSPATHPIRPASSVANLPRINYNESSNSPSRSRAPSSGSSSPRLGSTHIQNLYNQPGSTSRDTTISPVKGQATSAHSSIIAKPSSPSSSRASSPANSTRPRAESRLEDSLAVQLAGGGNRSRQGSVARSHSPVPLASSFSSASPRSSSPAPPPPLPRRIASPSNSTTAQLRQRSQTIDPSVSPVSPTDSRSRPPPQLPPRRSSTLDPLSSTKPTKVPLASSATIGSNSNLKPNRPLVPPSRSIPASSSSSSTSSSTAPALPRRKPTLPQYKNVSPRTNTSSFEPPPRPHIASKPTLSDPLSLPSSLSRSPNLYPLHSNPRSLNNPKNGSSTISSSFKIRPIDPRARNRYERLFDQCLLASPSSQDGAEEEEDEEEKVEGETVRLIWERSRLGRDTLRNVWSVFIPFSLIQLRRQGN